MAVVAGVLVLLAAVAMLIVWRASQQVPIFYAQAMEQADPVRQRQGSDQMLQRATALGNDVKKEGRWQARFTEEQVNGWLAVDLVKNHPGSLPTTMRDPRVRIEPSGVSLACRYRQGGFQSVLSLTVDVSLANPTTLALRIRHARAGALPLPLDRVLKEVAQAARQGNVRVEWRQIEGDPVALISVGAAQGRTSVQIDTLTLGQGEIVVAGTTRRR